MRWLAVLLTAAGLGVPAAATAAGGVPGVAASASAGGGLTLSASNVNGPLRAVISGENWTVHGVVASYVPGQRIALHVFRNGLLIVSRTLAVKRSGRHGAFRAALAVEGVGRLTVRAIHFATGAQRRMISPSYGVWLVAPQANPGERSYAVRILQRRLSALHYVVGAPGVYDARTQRAVLAFRKMVGLVRDEQADASVFAALAAGEGAFAIRYPSQGRHIEADLTHQVLALIDADGVVARLYPISSGKPSTPTALGSFRVYNKTPGTNSLGMVDSSYFNGGDAIHGYAEVPTYAASHGCLRCPIPDALSIYAWATLDTPVDVYYR